MMTTRIPFLQVTNVGQTIGWYQYLGFECRATNHIWEPDRQLNWARLEWEGTAFMVGTDNWKTKPGTRDSNLWFNVNTVDVISEMLKRNNIKMHVNLVPFCDRKVISFKDINGFEIFFCSESAKDIL